MVLICMWRHLPSLHTHDVHSDLALHVYFHAHCMTMFVSPYIHMICAAISFPMHTCLHMIWHSHYMHAHHIMSAFVHVYIVRTMIFASHSLSSKVHFFHQALNAFRSMSTSGSDDSNWVGTRRAQ